MHECPQCGYNPSKDTLDDIHFIYAERMVFRFGMGVQLTQSEMDLFEALYDADRRGLTMVDMAEAMYGHKADADQPQSGSNVISVVICRLRPKLRKIGLLIHSGGRGSQQGRYSLSKMRAISVEHARQMEAAQ